MNKIITFFLLVLAFVLGGTVGVVSTSLSYGNELSKVATKTDIDKLVENTYLEGVFDGASCMKIFLEKGNDVVKKNEKCISVDNRVFNAVTN